MGPPSLEINHSKLISSLIPGHILFLPSGVAPLSLEDIDLDAAAAAAAVAAGTSAGPSHVRTRASPWSDSSNGSPSPSKSRSTGRSPRFSEEYYRDDDDSEGEGDEGQSGDPERHEKKRRFLEARKSHYQMKPALTR